MGVDQLPDPVRAVEALLSKCKPEFLMEFYAVPRFRNAGAGSAPTARIRARVFDRSRFPEPPAV